MDQDPGDRRPLDPLSLARADLAEAVQLAGQAGIAYKTIAEAAEYKPNVVSRLRSRGHNSEVGPLAISRLTRAVSDLYPAAAAQELEPAAAARLGELVVGLTERYGDRADKGPELDARKHRLVYTLASYMLEQPACTVTDPKNAAGIIRRDLDMTDKEWPVAFRYLAGFGLFTTRKQSPKHKAYTVVTFEPERLLLVAEHLQRAPSFIDKALLEKARLKVPEMEQKRAQEPPAKPTERPVEAAADKQPAGGGGAWVELSTAEQRLPDVPASELDKPPQSIDQRGIKRRHYAGLASRPPAPPPVRREPPRRTPTGVRQPAARTRKPEVPQAPPVEPPRQPRSRPATPDSEKERRARQHIEVDCFRIALALTNEAMNTPFGGLDPMLARLSKHTGGLDVEVLDARRRHMVEQGWATYTVDDKGARFTLTAKGEAFRDERLAKAAQRARAAQAQNPQ